MLAWLIDSQSIRQMLTALRLPSLWYTALFLGLLRDLLNDAIYGKQYVTSKIG